MSTVGAMLLIVIVIGMLLAYYLGYGVGRREGIEQGRAEGKREAAVRAYAVGYDRGRHDRKTKLSEAEETPDKSEGRGCMLWLIPLLLLLLAVVWAALNATLEKGP